MSWLDFRERPSFIPVAGFQPRGFGSAYLNRRKGSAVARFIPAHKQILTARVYNYSSRISLGLENPLTLGLKFQTAWQPG